MDTDSVLLKQIPSEIYSQFIIEYLNETLSLDRILSKSHDEMTSFEITIFVKTLIFYIYVYDNAFSFQN